VEGYGLTITRFNEITVNLQNDPNLENGFRDCSASKTLLALGDWENPYLNQNALSGAEL